MNHDKYYSFLENILKIRYMQFYINDISRKNDIILYGNNELGRFMHNVLLKYRKDSIIIEKESLNNIDINKIYKNSISNTVILVCYINVPFYPIKKNILAAGFTKIMHCYEYLWRFYPEEKIENGWIINKTTDIMVKKIFFSYNHWCDELSRKSFISTLSWRINRIDLFHCDDMPLQRENFPPFVKEILTHKEVFVDCGAYVGNTIYNFLKCVDGNFEKIIAYEPDPYNYKMLQRNCDKFMTPSQIEHSALFNVAVYNVSDIDMMILSRGGASKTILNSQSTVKCISIDDALLLAPTIIKIHIEGNEFYALKGAVKKIKKYRPILIIALYHSENDFFDIPFYLMSSLSNYRFYHRKYKYCGQSEFIYSIPEERYTK